MAFYRLKRNTKLLFSILFPTMLFTWNQGFDLGAFGAVLYRSAVTAWVFALSIFIGLIYIRVAEKAPIKIQSLLILTLPVLWPAIDYIDHHIDNTYLHYFVIFDYIMIIFGLIYAAYLFLKLIKHDIFEPLSKGNKMFIVLLGAIFSALGFLAGHNNHLFLECSHFELSGDYIPDNCKRVEHNTSDFRTIHRQVW